MGSFVCMSKLVKKTIRLLNVSSLVFFTIVGMPLVVNFSFRDPLFADFAEESSKGRTNPIVVGVFASLFHYIEWSCDHTDQADGMEVH